MDQRTYLASGGYPLSPAPVHISELGRALLPFFAPPVSPLGLSLRKFSVFCRSKQHDEPETGKIKGSFSKGERMKQCNRNTELLLFIVHAVYVEVSDSGGNRAAALP